MKAAHLIIGLLAALLLFCKLVHADERDALAGRLVGVMVQVAPPDRPRPIGDAETEADRVSRYGEIASTIADVALDPAETPIPVGDAKMARTRTAAVLLAVSFYESAWWRSVDLGTGRYANGNAGQWCLFQVNLGERGRTREGWTGRELVGDRRRCVVAGLHLIRASFNACRARPLAERLNAYATGSCSRGAGYSRRRVETGLRWAGLIGGAT